MIGFNNIGFDYPVLHQFICNRGITYKELYDHAMRIIKCNDKFKYVIPSKKITIRQIDLYKIHHFDNQARATSLKMLEFNMRSDNIEDLPFPPGTKLNDHQKDVLIKYNKHDVMQTFKFYKESLKAIRFREDLSVKYGRDFLNHNDTKIGKDYFIMRLEEEAKGCCYDYSGGFRKIMQTKRDIIDLNDAVFPYVKFQRPEFQAVADWLRRQKIKETKGVFSGILEHELGTLAKYCNLTVKRKKFKEKPTDDEVAEFRKEYPLGWIAEKELKSGKTSYYKEWNVAEHLNAVVDGFTFDFGTGGIHGSVESQIVKSDDGFIIIDLDVASYYPNLAISNNVSPAHLGQKFCEIYKDVYEQRKSFDKGTPENAVMKLALNGVYGDSNSQFSPFYDPMYTMKITVNGQLLLCMLAEELMKIEDLSMVQINTDGLTVKIRREDQERLFVIAREWEKLTGLVLEEVYYSRMFIRDVNNYIAETTEGKLKRKGAYEYDDLGWHQNHSALVVKRAAEHVLVKGGDLRAFIRNHTDKHDFMLRTKVPRSSRLVCIDEDGEESLQQNICRYYASSGGQRLVKIMPPLPDKEDERRIGIDKEWDVKVCNDIKEFSWDIDYDYYIKETEKLVEPLLTPLESILN